MSAFQFHYGWLLFPICGVGLVVALIVADSAAKGDLEDRKLAAPRRVLQILRADVPTAATIDLEIDFRDPQKGGRVRCSEQDRFWIFWRTRRITYVHRWLTLRGVLADGTRFVLGLTDTVTVKEKRKRKYTKQRRRTRGTISIALRLRASGHTDANRIAEWIRAQRPRRRLTPRQVVGRENQLSCSLTTPDEFTARGRGGRETGGTGNKVTGDMLLEALLWVYDGVCRSRAA